jgi:hypothetical protein
MIRSMPVMLLLACSAAAAQSPGDAEIPSVAYPPLPEQAETVAGFVPAGWKLESSATGDVNRDGLPDAALVLHMDEPRNLVPSDWDPNQKYDSNPRILAVALARPGGGYELAAADHKLIPRLENQNQDDPFDGVEIVNGTLRVKLQLFMSAGGWQMGSWTYTFRWQDGAMKLIGFDSDTVMRNSGETETVSVNFLTGRKLVRAGNMASDEQDTRTLKLAKKPLLELGEVGDGFLFDPDGR